MGTLIIKHLGDFRVFRDLLWSFDKDNSESTTQMPIDLHPKLAQSLYSSSSSGSWAAISIAGTGEPKGTGERCNVRDSERTMLLDYRTANE